MDNITCLKEKANTKLTLRERKLWSMIKPQAGVLMAWGIPGISKSATFRSIAEKLDMQYIDLRTSTKDETDFGTFPISNKNKSGDYFILNHAIPEWAIRANSRPTLVHFEEINLAPPNIRSAVLGILLERVIGENFKLNHNVFMVASGNPPTKFNNDIEEFGHALRNRLIMHEFNLTLEQWKKEFAEENVGNEIISFLTQKPDFFGNTQYQMEKFIGDDSTKNYPSPRSWTNLSEYFKGYGEINASLKKDIMTDITIIAGYVGEIPATSFVNYITETFKINVNDVLEGKVDLNSLDNMTIQRIISEFEDTRTYVNLNKKEKENWKKFISVCNDEIKAGYFSNLLSGDQKTENELEDYKDLISPYGQIIDRIVKGINQLDKKG